MLEIEVTKSAVDLVQDDTPQTHLILTLDKESLFAGVRPRLLRLARLRGVAPDALDDVVQDTLLVAFRLLDRLQSPEHFQLWADEICQNICHRYQRAYYRDASRHISLFEPSLHIDELEEAFLASIPGVESLDPAEVLSHNDLALLLERALGSLPVEARQAVELYYLLDLPQREAAVNLGLSISALETRLHRARRQLRQVLNGALRTEAASLGLPLDEEPAMGWRETRQWCYFCGHRHLHGSFESSSDGHQYLRMRCPECSHRYGFDIVNGKGIVQLDGLRSFQPAFKRTMQGISQHLLQSVIAGESPCIKCGRPVPVQVGGPKKESSQTVGQRQFWVGGTCSHCGYGASFWSADDAVYWSDPTIQQFMLQYPRWLNEPDLSVEYGGQPAILFRLSDSVSTARLNVITHRQTLQVLATFKE